VTLRTRLVIGLLVLTAAGLITLAAVTYAEQRSFLFDRVDQQAQSARFPVSAQLDRAGANVPGGIGRDAGRPPLGDDHGGPPHGALPAGYAVGQRRDAHGNVLGNTVVVRGAGQQELPAPRFPAQIRTGQEVTVSAVGNSGLKYRVYAFPTLDQPGSTLVAIPLGDVTSTLHRLLRVEALVIGAVLIALGGLAWWVVRLGLRPLERMGHTAGAIAAGELSERGEHADSDTEVGWLGLALNEMLSQIETAFAERTASENRLRRFLADASHELRTPLVSIRGYAELFRIGAARDQDETEKAMRRIEEEARRMGVLVEDMLTLARLDEVREPVREPVDLERVAADAVEDARAVAPERSIELVADTPARVLGDPHQLGQVMANLMRNALTHTPAAPPSGARGQRRRRRPAGGARPRPRPPARRSRRPVRALLARGSRARARRGRRRGPRPRDRGGDRGRPRRQRDRVDRGRRGCLVPGQAADAPARDCREPAAVLIASSTSAGAVAMATIARNQVVPASVPSPRECTRPRIQASAV
jgi:two-component system OmpR family sensor kinase